MNTPPPLVHPVIQTVVLPTTIPMNSVGNQLIQMPNGQLFMLPMNSYPGAQPVTLQAVQPVGVNNEALKNQ